MKFDFFITYLLDLTFDIVITFSLFFLYKTFKDIWIKLSLYTFVLALICSLALRIYAYYSFTKHMVEKVNNTNTLFIYFGYMNYIFYYIAIVMFFIFSFKTYRFFKK